MPRRRRAVIIGGSVSGLFAAAFLRRIGWQVDVFERSSVELVGHLERWQLRDCAGWICAAAPCTMTEVSTGSRLQDHDHAE
jgi:glycine/D-amino acid oxidase-like deaminating enzyme